MIKLNIFCLISLSFLLVQASQVSNFKTYPTSNRIWLSIEMGMVKPHRFQQFQSKEAGELTILVEDQTQIKQGQHWAVWNQEVLQLAEDEFALEQQQQQHKLQEAIIQKKNQFAKNEIDFEELRRKKIDLESLLKNAEMGDEFKKRSRLIFKRLEEQITDLAPLCNLDFLDQQIQLEKNNAELILKRKTNELKNIRKNSYLTAEVDGKIIFSNELHQRIKDLGVQKNQAFTIKDNTFLATILDDQQYQIVIEQKDSSYKGLPVEDLMVLLEDAESGQLIKAHFDHAEEFIQQNETKKVLYFNVLDQYKEVAKNAINRECVTYVYREFKEQYFLIPKQDLIAVNPSLLENKGWYDLVNSIWTDAQIVQVGPQTILMKAKDETGN